MSHLLWFGPFTGSDTSLDDWLLERATSLSIISAWDRFLSPSMKKKIGWTIRQDVKLVI